MRASSKASKPHSYGDSFSLSGRCGARTALAPNRLPEEPLPKAAPTSAPLPCWSRTRPMMQSAMMTSTMSVKVNQKSMLYPSELSLRCGADRDEVLRRERRPADQPAVNIGHRKQLRCIAGLDAAPVHDRYALRLPLIARREPRANECVHVLGLARRRVFAGADRPDRFVGERRVGERSRPGGGEHRIELAPDHAFGLAALALFQGLAHAQNRSQAGALGRDELGGDSAVVLCIQAATLGMADDREAAAELLQHRS